MSRLRLNADAATTRLVKNGTVKIVLINPGEPTAEWRKDMEGYPYEWGNRQCAQCRRPCRHTSAPATYLLDNDFHIIAKRLDINQLIGLMATINHNQVLNPTATALMQRVPGPNNNRNKKLICMSGGRFTPPRPIHLLFQ